MPLLPDATAHLFIAAIPNAIACGNPHLAAVFMPPDSWANSGGSGARLLAIRRQHEF
jgi:hypothetical protein